MLDNNCVVNPPNNYPVSLNDDWIWGVGPVLQFNTACDDRLLQGVWRLGPSAVALKMTGPWVIGGLVNNVWSISEDSGRADVNQLLFQPFINYNFPDQAAKYQIRSQIQLMFPK